MRAGAAHALVGAAVTALSPGEREVLTRRARGEPLKTIASDRASAVTTVAELQRRALVKLGAATIEEAVAVSEELFALLHTAADGSATIAPRLNGDEIRELRRALASALTVLDRALARGVNE